MFTALVVVALGVLLCAAVYFGVRQIRMLQAEVVSLHRTQTLACTTAEIEDVVHGMLPYVIEEAAEAAAQSLSMSSTSSVTGLQCSEPNGKCNMADAYGQAEDKGDHKDDRRDNDNAGGGADGRADGGADGRAGSQDDSHVTGTRPTSTRAATAVAEAKYAAVREATTEQ
jgi:hypothetical protein